MVLKRIKEFAALYRYLQAHADGRAACGLAHMPDESTLRKRLKKLRPAVKRQIRAWGRELIKQAITSAEIVSVDKKMIRAQGPLWHKLDRQLNKIPDGLRGLIEIAAGRNPITEDGYKATAPTSQSLPRPACR